MRTSLFFATAALLGACGCDGSGTAKRRPAGPPVSLQRRGFRTGDRLSVRIVYVQLRARDARKTDDASTVTTGSITATLDYEDEVRQAEAGRVLAVRRRWSSDPANTTSIRVVDGRMAPRVDYFSQFDALLPPAPVRVGETWRVDAPLGPFNLRPGGLHVLVARSKAACTLLRAKKDGASRVALIEAHLEVTLADGAELELVGRLEFDLSQRILETVRVYQGELCVFDASRALRAAP